MPEASAEHARIPPFAVRDCALVTIATGLQAQNLKEFREGLRHVPADSIDHHFWGRLLRPYFDEPEYNNDFASWAWRGLHDKPLAERLSMVVPTDFASLEELRQELLEVLDQRLDESEYIPWARADQKFHFLRGGLVVFDTGLSIECPADIVPLLSSLSTGSIYYHFIDARSRTPLRCDDFSAWLAGCGEQFTSLRDRLSGIDPYFSSLKEIRQMVAGAFQRYFSAEG